MDTEKEPRLMRSTQNELRRRWALARGWTALACQTSGCAPRTVWRQPDWVEGRALEEHELPFRPDDMNSVLAEYRGLDSAVRLRVVQRMAWAIDQRYGNGEVAPTDCMNPAEITASILGLKPEEIAQALVEALENKEYGQ